MTPTKIRAHASEQCGWKPGVRVTESLLNSVAYVTGQPRSLVARALKKTGKPGRKPPTAPLKVISIRMRADREPIALRLAHQAGHRTVSAWVQGLVEMEIREATKGNDHDRHRATEPLGETQDTRGGVAGCYGSVTA